MHWDQLFCDIPILDICGGVRRDFDSVTSDSRRVMPGGVFVCLEGRNADGHAYIKDAAERGAAVAVVSHALNNSPIPFVVVDSVRAAYATLMSNLNGRPGDRLRLFAVTGTNGKTSVSTFLREIFKTAGYKAALVGTIGGNMTTPDPDVLYPLLRKLADNGTEIVVMEASSHALALKKLAPLSFECGMFTNLTMDHGDFHPTVQDYFEAKASLFEQCKTGIFNLDDKFGRHLFDSKPSENVYGISACESPVLEADFSARNIVLDENGARYDLSAPSDIFRIWTDMPWKFAVYNTLTAAACAYISGVEYKYIQKALSDMKCVSGRLERYNPEGSYPGYPRIYIDYAHTPDALENSLNALRGIMKQGEKLTVLFGCGGDRDREKRPIMGKTATDLADLTIITSDNSRSEDPYDIISDIEAGISGEASYITISDRSEAIRYALSQASDREILLLAGKGHEEYIIDKAGKHFFSEKAILDEYYSDVPRK